MVEMKEVNKSQREEESLPINPLVTCAFVSNEEKEKQ